MQMLRQTAKGKSVLWWAMAMVGLLFIGGPGSLSAQDFPSKTVTVLVPFGPGGIVDVGSRILADSLSKELKVPVAVENKTGAAGMVASSAFLNRPPDGYTLFAASGSVVISAVQLSKAPPYDPRKDFLPVGYLADAPCAMAIAKNAPFNTYEEFVKYAKANPGKLRGGIAALGGEPHIMFETILRQNKIECKVIPYPAHAQLVTAILGGHLDWMCLSLIVTMPYHKSGDLKTVLLTRRAVELPGVPAGTDVGLPDVSLNLWTGFFAHSKTPKPIYDKLVAAVSAAAKDPEVAKKLANVGCILDYKGPQEFSTLLARQWDIYAKIIKEANIKVD
jgi:tripartite-type tricarboxylate transporter receptor subunit TctC